MNRRGRGSHGRTKPPVQQRGRTYEAQDPSVFAGPATWVAIHSAAATYTPSKKNSFIKLIQGIGETFPCERCQRNFAKHLQELPLGNYLANRDQLFLWTYLMHDKVNQLKHVKSPAYKDVKKYYFESLDIKCSDCY